LADSGALGFLSDRDEAINIAVKALLDGRYPYDCRVLPGIHSGCPDSGNPIGPMPGAYLFAAPLVLLFGSAASLSLMAVAVVFFGLRAYWNRADNSLICLLGLLLTMPVSGADILTGGDHFANTVFVSIPLILLIQEPSRKYALGLAFLLGCALSWRGLFWMAMVPTLMFFIRQGLIKETLRLGISCSVGFLLVTLPLWLWNPAGFSPLQVQQRYNLYQHIMPHAGLIIPVCTLTLGLFLGWRAKTRDGLYIACGWVLLLPILIGAMFNSIELGRPTLLFYGWYSLTSLFFFTIPYLSAKFKS
jgi:hypothetical protein